MTKPKAVLISDIHYNINNLELASASLGQAISASTEFKVPLIIAGDLHDTKALMRAECVNSLLNTFKQTTQPIFLLVGNHDLINEKGAEHSLSFLSDYCVVVDAPLYDSELDIYMIPYHSDRDKLREFLKTIPSGSTLIMHQGLEGAKMGEYVLDKSSLPKECFSDFRVISGHYHQAQDIKCGRPRKGAVGMFSYIGTPYTTSFAEANDGLKGFQLLMPDGLLEHVPTHLRKHVILEQEYSVLNSIVESGVQFAPMSEDIIWLKVIGDRNDLDSINKKLWGEKLFGKSDYKLEKIYTDSDEAQSEPSKEQFTPMESLFELIDKEVPNENYRAYLKSLVQELL